MQKLTLDLDRLNVEPFETGPAQGEAEGGVFAASTVGSFTAPYAYCLRQPATRSDPCVG